MGCGYMEEMESVKFTMETKHQSKSHICVPPIQWKKCLKEGHSGSRDHDSHQCEAREQVYIK